MWKNNCVLIFFVLLTFLVGRQDLYCISYPNPLVKLPSGKLLSDYFSSDTTSYILKQLDNATGISHSSVNTVFQDSDNLLWLGTWDGLNRYDGHSFKVFRPELNNDDSLSNQVVLKVTEDLQGNIWILTMHGINRYDKQTDNFERFYFSKKDKVTLTDTEFNMALSPDKKLFAYAKEWGIGVFNQGAFEKIWDDTLLRFPIVQMKFLGKDKLLVLDASGQLSMLQLQQEMGTVKAMGHATLVENILSFEALDKKNLLLINFNGTPIIFSVDTENQEKMELDKPSSIIGSVKDGVVISSDTQHFLVGKNKGVSTPRWLSMLNGNKLTALFEGTEGIYWAATDGEGVFRLHQNNKPFHGLSGEQIPDFEGTIVRSFLEVPNHSFWIGTKGKGVFRFPPDFLGQKKEKLKYINLNQENSGLNNAVYSLKQTKEDFLLIGTDGPGVSLYDLKEDTFVPWDKIKGTSNLPQFKSVYALYQGEDGIIWAGTSGFGLVRFKLIRTSNGVLLKEFEQYMGNRGAMGEISSNMIYSIVPKNKESLWIGTRLGGLNLFNKKTKTFSVYMHDERNPKSLSNNDILCMYRSPKGELWIGTSFGLNRYTGESEFLRYTVKDGLPSNTIHGITSDRAGNIWVSTNYGLSKFDIADQVFYNYTKEEGLQDNEFGDGAAYAGSEYIFMGGRKGFNYFVPERINASAKVPNLFINKISGQDGSAPYDQNLVIRPDGFSPSVIELKHDQNFLNIEFSALTFINNKKCRYAYQLKNFDPDWNQIGARTNLSFTNIPSGEYELWLKWTNGDGVWSQPVEAVRFNIAPIFWRSATAWTLYAVLLALFILFALEYYHKRQSLARNILIRKQEERAHENRLDFFTNVAHELQTPLTLMVAPVQKLGETMPFDRKARKYFDMVKKNTSRLLFLTQQILEFRKAEDGHLKINSEHFDLVNLVEQIAELFDEIALKKNIDYVVDLPKSLMGWYDKDLIEKIIFNLLSNAFKYTPEEGFIELDIKIHELDGERNLVLNIANSGEGIPKEKLDDIFEKFYLLDQDKEVGANMFRTGIGLAYTKKLVQLLKGNISVASEPNKSTTFRVELPCGKADVSGELTSPTPYISQHLRDITDQGEENQETKSVYGKLETLEQQTKKTQDYVLVVEDDPEVQYLLEELLGNVYYLETASNGERALDLIKKKEPILILSDVMMPIMDGVELCKRVKNDLDTCHIPFVMLTAKDSMDHKIIGIESGANDYISKPFHPDYLLMRIQKLLEERERMLKHFSQGSPFEDLTALITQDDDKIFIERLMAVIGDNLENEKLQSSFLEQELGVSTSQLYRRTKELLNFSPGDLIRTVRLRHASELLRKTNLTVTEVCYRSGFNNRSYFYREFKKLFHKTPKDYQLFHKKDLPQEQTIENDK